MTSPSCKHHPLPIINRPVAIQRAKDWYELEGTGLRILNRYSAIGTIGRGAQGWVLCAYDHVTQGNVVIKKLLEPFKCPRLAKLTYRELVLMTAVAHPNVRLPIHNYF